RYGKIRIHNGTFNNLVINEGIFTKDVLIENGNIKILSVYGGQFYSMFSVRKNVVIERCHFIAGEICSLNLLTEECNNIIVGTTSDNSLFVESLIINSKSNQKYTISGAIRKIEFDNYLIEKDCIIQLINTRIGQLIF